MATPLRRLVLLAAAAASAVTLCVFPTSAQAALTCGGTHLAKPGGGYWACTWDDEFNLTYLDLHKWSAQTTAASGIATGEACLVASARNIYVNSGTLKLVARKETKPFVCQSPTGNFTTQYTAGSVFSFGKFSQMYGRFEIRAAFPTTTVRGLQQALWMWPNNPTKYGAWPASGEIDIAEHSSLYARNVVPYIHYYSGTDMNVTNNYCTISNVGAFHKYALVWSPTTMTITIDGVTCVRDVYAPNYATTGSSKPFDQPFFMALTAGLGVGTNAFIPGKTPLPGVTKVDYVRAWQ
jgi:beta-glucanase (GH16 family)